MDSKMNTILILTLAAVLAMAWGKPRPARRPQKMVELTHLLTKDFPYHPRHLNFMLNVSYDGPYPPKPAKTKFFLEMNKFQTSEHGGTHYDAPSHFFRNAWHTENVPLKTLMGEGVIINVQEQARRIPNYAVTMKDVQDWERRNGRIPKGAYVIMNSGWFRYADNVTKFLGNDKQNTSDFRFPGWGGEATKWLLDNREIGAIGVDTISIDKGNTNDWITHRLALGTNHIGLENVANLDAIPEAGTMIYAFPIYIRNGTGGPTRIVAMWDDDAISAAPRHVTEAILMVVLTLVAMFL